MRLAPMAIPVGLKKVALEAGPSKDPDADEPAQREEREGSRKPLVYQ